MEYHILLELKNIKGIIQTYNCYAAKDFFVYTLEYPYPCQDMFDYIFERKWLKQTEAKQFLLQIIDIVSLCLAKKYDMVTLKMKIF